VALFFIGCAGISPEQANKKVDEGHKLWDEEKKAEAVAKYKEALPSHISDVRFREEDRPKVFQRIIEFDLAKGDESSAKKFIEKALVNKVALPLEDEKGKALVAQVEREIAEREAAAKAKKEAEGKEAAERANQAEQAAAKAAQEKKEQEEKLVAEATIEKVNAFPSKYEGLTVEFKKAKLNGEMNKEGGQFFLRVTSADGLYIVPQFTGNEGIAFVVSDKLAQHLLEYLKPKFVDTVNITCTIKKRKSLLQTQWAAEVSKVDFLALTTGKPKTSITEEGIKQLELIPAKTQDKEATEDKKPVGPSEPQEERLTADFLPHKAGIKRYEYGEINLVNPANVTLHLLEQKDKGVIEKTMLKVGRLNGFIPEWTKDVNHKSKYPQYHRVTDNFVEIGDHIGETEKVFWEPVIKIGAKVDDKWEWNPMPGMANRYRVMSIRKTDRGVEAVISKTSVTELGNTSIAIGNRLVYLQGVGLVSSESYTLEKGQKKTTARVRLPTNEELKTWGIEK
jgi:hypothetical protein